jgi:hypothetical protein
MKHRALNLFLVIVFLSGAVRAWQTGRQRSRLEVRYARLVNKTGDYPIADPSEVYVGAIETGEPLHFAWRVYFPPKYNQIVTARVGRVASTRNTSSTPSLDFIARVRIREDTQGVLQLNTRFAGGGSQIGLGDKTLAELLRGRWDKIRVEQLGAAGLSVVEPDKSAVLLRLTLPGDLRDEARKKLSAYAIDQCIPEMFSLKIGPEAMNP